MLQCSSLVPRRGDLAADASDAVPFFEELGSESTLDKLKIPFTLGFGQLYTFLRHCSLTDLEAPHFLSPT
jgi:hypothetical protein